MKPVNKYAKGAKISEAKFRMLVKCFTSDLPATQTAEITGINRNTVNRYFNVIRERICEICSQENPFKDGVVENGFGSRAVNEIRRRTTCSKIIILGLWEQENKVYTEIVPDTLRQDIQEVIRGHVDSGNVIRSDEWRAYDALVDIDSGKYYRFDHEANEIIDGKKHVSGTENFWIFTKMRLVQFHGIRKDKFLLHLKECEFRFNHKNEDIYKLLLITFRNQALL